MYTLTVYTHTWCSDCQLAKRELKQNKIEFVEIDLGDNPEKENELKQTTGSRIVPGFVFKEKSLLKKFKKPIVFTGYEMNKEEIWKHIDKMK